jgi:hypothetical protein
MEATIIDPAPFGYYDTRDLRARFRWGRTKLYQVIHEPGLPAPRRPLGTYLWPKHLVWAWESGLAAAAAPPSEPAPPGPLDAAPLTAAP